MSDAMVNISKDDRGVVRIVLNRPEVRNAFNAELIAAITDAFADPPTGARVMVISGEGKAFSAGADLQWMKSMTSFTREQNVADSSALADMLDAIDNCAVPVIGRVHGAAVAGATGLVACCDIAIAGRSTVFAFTEVRLGLIPAVISPYVMRRVGYGFARSAFLTAERFDAETAERVGLIYKAVDDSALDEEVEKIIGALLAGGPESLAGARALVDAVWGKSPQDSRDFTVNAISERRVSDEAQEGIAAFFEKRAARWVPPSQG
ncbi:MAG: enoyl-CoA hydratase-related protein [Actinomycetota bacterium]|nr:enoyl-CoA hydratase/isomerase family protein [Actinomycetota bacterium]